MLKKELILVLIIFSLLIPACQDFSKTGAAVSPDTLCLGVKCNDYCGAGSESSVRYYAGGCTKGTCTYISSDCNTLDHYVDDSFCKEGNVYKNFRNYYCSGGKCLFEELDFLQEKCSKGCVQGVCKP